MCFSLVFSFYCGLTKIVSSRSFCIIVVNINELRNNIRILEYNFIYLLNLLKNNNIDQIICYLYITFKINLNIISSIYIELYVTY